MIFSISTFFWGTLYYHHQHTTTQNASYFCLLVIAIKMKCNYIHFRLAGLEVEASHSKFLNEVSTVSFFFSPPSPPPTQEILHSHICNTVFFTRCNSAGEALWRRSRLLVGRSQQDSGRGVQVLTGILRWTKIFDKEIKHKNPKFVGKWKSNPHNLTPWS